MENKLEHKHLLVRAEVKNPLQSEAETVEDGRRRSI